MSLTLIALSLLGGAALLVGEAHLLVEAASRFARNLGIPAVVVGVTVVAYGTSSPELVVTVLAAREAPTSGWETSSAPTSSTST